MSYDDFKNRYDREPVAILKLYLNICSLTFGASPCQATTSDAGLKCFNTFGTCQDPVNFSGSTAKPLCFTSRYIKGLQAAGGFPIFPTLMDYSIAPTTLTPGKGLGARQNVSVQLADHPFGDTGGIDPYLAERNYDPDFRGSFWGKLIARYKFLENTRAVLEVGYLDDDGAYDAANFLARDLVVWRVAGPSEDGMVRVTLKDPIKYADGDKAVFPFPSAGKLQSDISDTATTLDIGTDNIQEYKDSLDAGQAYVIIGEEPMEMASVNIVAGTIDVTGGRASLPSNWPDADIEAKTHSAGDTVQVCYYFNAKRVDSVLTTLLTGDASGVEAFQGAGLDAALLDDWSAVVNAYLTGHVFDSFISSPTPVKDLITEICQLNVWIWWDERIISPNTTGKIKLDTVRAAKLAGEELGEYNETEHIINSSLSKSRSEDGRISRVFLYYAIRNPIKDLTEPSNYPAIQATADLDAELDEEYKKSAIKTIFSRWLPLSRQLTADTIAGRLLQEYRDTKNIVSFSVDAKDTDKWTGELAYISTASITDIYGDILGSIPYIILEAKEDFNDGNPRYKLKAISRVLDSKTGGYTGDTQNNYAGSTTEERNSNAFYADASGKIPPTGDPPYTYR